MLLRLPAVKRLWHGICTVACSQTARPSMCTPACMLAAIVSDIDIDIGIVVAVVASAQFGYALRALVINEFTGPDWTQRVWGVPGARTLGQAALVSFDFATSRVWITYGILFL